MKSPRGYLHPEVAIVHCDQSPSCLGGHIENIWGIGHQSLLRPDAKKS